MQGKDKMTEKEKAIFNEFAYEYTRNQPKGLKPLIPDILSMWESIQPGVNGVFEPE